MKRSLLFVLGLFACVCLALPVHAENTVFDDAFTEDSLNPVTYPAPTPTSTGWTVASNKGSPAPVVSDGALTINMAGTSAGYVEAQALFSPEPVKLLPGTYIELVATVVPTYVLTNSSDNLVLALLNSGGSAPVSGLLSSGLSSSKSDFATGGAKAWLGYNANIPLTGASARMTTRAAQTGASNTVQDVIFGSQSGSVGYSTPAGSNISFTGTPATTFTNGNTYTLSYKLTLSLDGTTLTAVCSVYNGTGTTGNGANDLLGSASGTITGANLLTTEFDALALGWRADAGTANPSNLKLVELTIKTTGGTPWFVVQPPSSTLASLGSGFTLNTTVDGEISAYQWQKSTDGGAHFSDLDTGAIPSAATASLTLSSIQNSDAGIYRLVLTNGAGSRTSNEATVTISSSPLAPSISTQPASATRQSGSSYSFSVLANGSAPMTYQWEKSTDGVDFTPIAGALAASYTIDPIGLSDEAHYRVVVTNSAGEETSAAATLSVSLPLTITSQPAGATINAGVSHTLSVSVTGRPDPTYQWYQNGSPLSGATNATLSIPAASGADSGLYKVLIENSTGDSVMSEEAALVVLSPSLAVTEKRPASSSVNVAPDARLTLTFNQAVSPGLSGQIRIYDASNPASPVDTIDLISGTARMKALRAGSTLSTQALPVETKTIGGLGNFNYYPLTIAGNTVTVYPRNRVLDYGKTYYVIVEAGVFTDSTGLAFSGLTTDTAWVFSTRASAPSTEAARLVVAPDGSGDFCTIQGALDFIPSSNTTPRTIYIKKGIYFEQVYFTGKHSLTFLGEDRTQSILTYPNNNNFNNASGTYHRMVMQADHVNNSSLVNLTILNSTPQGGSQAEALVLNGTTTSQAIVTNVDLFSYQDTLLANGQAYFADCHITGDVDFMWGNGPSFFQRCRLTTLRTGGYFTQIRNGNTNHGFVYLDCVIDANGSLTGNALARIDPNGGAFPYSEVVWLNCVMGSQANGSYSSPVSSAGWLLNNTADQSSASAPTIHFWEYNSHYSDNTPLDVSSRIGASRQLTQPGDASLIANYSTPSWVLGNAWEPKISPVIASQPVAQSVSTGFGFTLTVQAAAVPAPTFQWQRNGEAIPSATSASYTVDAASSGNAGNYSVVVTSDGVSVPSDTVVVSVTEAAPVIHLNPSDTTALRGTTATFSVWAQGGETLTYQWRKGTQAIPGATGQSLRLTDLDDSAVAAYSVVVTNGAGSTESGSAQLTLSTPAAPLPVQPIIPANHFLVTAYGAVGDGTTDNTAAIQAALNAANAAGGGTVEFTPASGVYLSGPLSVASHTNVQIDEGATLQALPFGTYPNSNSAPAHFISMPSGTTDIEFSGGGVIEGNGSAWWAAYDANTITNRPRLLQFTRTTKVLVTGITLQNSPQFNMAFSSPNAEVTIHGVTILAPDDSPNTDGIDLSGINMLVQGSYISVGDDNVVAKPGSVFCANLMIADCSFGTGHGVSVGGQTNVGLDGMTVQDCTFNGTDTGLRLKADPTQGGPVKNITYKNITMTNVVNPILIYSYYNTIGTPGRTSSSGYSPAKAAIANATPPTPLTGTTIPVWTDIHFSNITITGASNYCMIWGLPNTPVARVTFENFSLQGNVGWRIYNAQDVRFTGTQEYSLANPSTQYVIYNACVFTDEAKATATPGASGSLTLQAPVEGSSGVSLQAPAYRWQRNGVVLFDGTQADGTLLSGTGSNTLSISGIKAALAASYVCAVTAAYDSYNPEAGQALPAGGSQLQYSNPVAITGGSGTASLDAGSRDGDVAYQWQHYNSALGLWEALEAGAGVSGSQSPQLALSGLASDDDGDQYRCLVATTSIPRIAGLTTLAVRGSRLVNLSARVGLQEGGTLIPGFITVGPRRVLVRAVGPGLSAYGITTPLADPRMAFYNGTSLLSSNDNWDPLLGDVFADLGAFALGAASKDAALVADISDANTAHISAASGAGVVLAEVFDSSKRGEGRLVNCSARSQVSDGDNILVAGFVIHGNEPLRVLIRGIGPGLDQFTVPNTLENPRIVLFRGLDPIASNDDWDPSLAPLMQELGAFALTPGSKDAALVLTLEPGLYTVEVRSADSSTGEALVELYEARE